MKNNTQKKIKMDRNGHKTATKKTNKRKAGDSKNTEPKPYYSETLYKVSQVAEILQCNRKTIIKLINNGELKASLLPAGRRIKGSWIDDLIKNRIISHN